MKKILIICVCACLALNVSAQDVKIPVNCQLIKAEDYEPYKDSVKMVAQWLVNSPLNQNKSNRQLANRFVFQWISGAPYTHINIQAEYSQDVISDGSNPYNKDLFMNYLSGMILLKIEKNDTSDLFAQKAGVKAMLNGYKSIKQEAKNKFLEKLLKLEDKGELEAWIESKFREL